MNNTPRNSPPSFPFKLAAVDIDQTLVGPDKRIGAANRSALRALQDLGCRVVLASGRRHDNMLSYHRELGLDDFVISTQGAIVRHPARSRPLYEATLAPPDVAELITEGERRGLTVMHWSRRGVVANARSRWVEHYIQDCHDSVTISDVNNLAAERAEKLVWGAAPAQIAAISRQLSPRLRQRFEVTITDGFFIEFTAPRATKAAGVAAVARHYNIDPAHVLAFGDGNNDVSMLQWAGLGVAMSHARPAAQVAADLIAPTGDPESSLARAIHAVLHRAGIPATHTHPTHVAA
jgi:hypothetical protein